MKANQVISPRYPSPIGWLGGKTKLRPTIITCMPPHKCFVEVFCGSATIFFGKPPSRLEIINDIDGELVNLMKVISGTYFDESIRQEFIRYVRDMPASRELFENWKTWKPDQINVLSPAQRAFRFYYCVKKGFSSCPKGGYEASPISSSRYNQKTDFEKFARRFRETNAQIEHMDFVDLIIKYNRVAADTFFVMDPPYFIADDTNYYEFVFDKEKHQKLKSMVDQIDKNDNKFLITYDDVPEVIRLYDIYRIYRTDELIYSSADERGERSLVKTELFITNYDIAEIVGAKNQNSQHSDMFAETGTQDDRIDVPGHSGLTRING